MAADAIQSADIFDGVEDPGFLIFDRAVAPSYVIPRVTDSEVASIGGYSIPENAQPISFVPPQSQVSTGGRLYEVASWDDLYQAAKNRLTPWWSDATKPTGERSDLRPTPAAEVQSTAIGGWLVATALGLVVAYLVTR